MVRMATGEQVGACPVGQGGCRTQTALGVPSVGGSWGAAGSLRGWSWGSSGLSHLPLQRQQERRRQRAQQQELLPAEILDKHPLQNRYGRPGRVQLLPALGGVCWGWRETPA